MRNTVLIVLVFLVYLVSCGKDDVIRTSGTITINNTTYFSQTYYVYGFLFSEAKLVSTLSTPDPDITVISDGTYLYFQTTSLYNSFYKFGDYNDPASAETAFVNLISFTMPQWEALAERIMPNQIWIIRTENECYAKIRIISTVCEVREGHDYAECTFEWVYQPDGTLTFPGK